MHVFLQTTVEFFIIPTEMMPARSAIKEIVAHSEELRRESEALWQEFQARYKLSPELLKHAEILE